MRKPIATMCPRIDAPCQQLPKFESAQKSAFCDLCGKHVHNLSAMTRPEQDQLFETQAHPCIRYARLIPATVLLLATSGPILAQESQAARSAVDKHESAAQDEELEEIVVTGGGGRGPRLEPMFLQSELDADMALDDTNKFELTVLPRQNKVESDESH
jgi:hypothetical protein